MDFTELLRQFTKRVESMKDSILTEEATKTSIIMPFFQLMGYDVFNPTEFVPEFTADVGIKKGEKVDYAILQDGQPSILIEAKWIGEKLEKHDSQLFRYFGTTNAKFAILTNGAAYKFYTDLEEPNKMDESPFLEINLLNLKELDISELKKFHKENFDLKEIFDTASELKYSNLIKNFMAGQLIDPSDEYVRFVLGNIYAGVKTQNVVDKFKPVVKKSMNQYINELMNERIKSALEKNSIENESRLKPGQETANSNNDPETPATTEQSDIVTTMEELESYFIIKAILREIIDAERITYKDTLSYFGILLDDNTRKWVCRIYFKENTRYIIIPDENQTQNRFDFEKIDELYSFKDHIIKRIETLS